MTSTEWMPMDSSASEMHTETHVDFFSGDLFGDELMDIYHTVAAVDSHVDDNALIPSELSIIQAAFDTALSTPTIVKSHEDLCDLKTSSSFPDFLLAEKDPSAHNPSTATTLNAKKRKVSKPSVGARPAAKKKSSSAVKSIGNNIVPPSLIPSATIKLEKNELSKSEPEETKSTSSSSIVTSSKTNMQVHKGSTVGQSAVTSNVQETNQVSAATFMERDILPTSPSIVKSSNLQQSFSLINSINSQQNDNMSIQTTDSVDKNPKTEESFKGIAKAAVFNLIQNACSAKITSGSSVSEDSDSDCSSSFKRPVNTSTAHINALTSTNWIAACASSVNGAPPGTMAAAQAAALAAAQDPASVKLARSRRASLSSDERASLNRDRNREHARNTRLRKKAYVEELKRTLTDLVAQRDAAEVEKRHEKQRDLEVREVRFRVMEEFLKLRARGSESNLLARWVAILEDGFSLTLPRTDYRPMVLTSYVANSAKRSGSDGSTTLGNSTDTTSLSSAQVLRGASECMDDASKLHAFLNSFGRSVVGRPQNIVRHSYICDRKHFLMDGANAFLEWILVTSGVSVLGASSELTLKGYMRSTFSPASNKLICAELIFDTGNVMAQVKTLRATDLEFLSPSLNDDFLDSLIPKAQSVSRTPSDKGESDEESQMISLDA